MKDVHPSVNNILIRFVEMEGTENARLDLPRHPLVRCCRGMQSTALQCSGAVRVHVYARST